MHTFFLRGVSQYHYCPKMQPNKGAKILLMTSSSHLHPFLSVLLPAEMKSLKILLLNLRLYAESQGLKNSRTAKSSKK